MFTDDKNKIEVIICVSHGNSVDASLPLWREGDYPGRNCLCYGVEYCSTTVLNCLEPGKPASRWQLQGDFGTSEHIGLGKAFIMPLDPEDY